MSLRVILIVTLFLVGDVAGQRTCPPSSPPQEDPRCPPEGCDMGYGSKCRYLSFHAGDPGLTQAVRVTFDSLPSQWGYAEGRTMWVQEPYLVSEAAGSSGPIPPPTFWAAELGCAPFYTEWSVYDVVDVFDDGIVGKPDRTEPLPKYDVQVIQDDCALQEENFSAPLIVGTSLLGDILGNRAAPPPPSPPQGVCDFNDIGGAIDNFKANPAKPRKARADIINSDINQAKPDQIIDFVDISCVVECFRGQTCPLAGPPMTDPCAPG